ncbi:MAG: hypothetical protein ACLFQY_22480, partial [Desulfococcaceae bacterium]
SAESVEILRAVLSKNILNSAHVKTPLIKSLRILAASSWPSRVKCRQTVVVSNRAWPNHR